MATFRKRGPYQWQAQVRKKGYPLQTKTFETKAAAETWARATEYEMDQGLFVSRAEAESTTLRALLERYQEEVTPLKKGARVRVLPYPCFPQASACTPTGSVQGGQKPFPSPCRLPGTGDRHAPRRAGQPPLGAY
ncbi:MAG: hypothetical protein KZQ78_16310 [Candidatus Thiodiazotropha sp. (ex Ustalcina ferruginea)]|nr:hypothetical protein [Candidatus Thiodiazotropha sp. (ex Ustalcina ferruginea)]